MSTNQTQTLQPQLDRIRQPALVIGLVGLVICLGLAFIGRQQFFQSYLVGYLFWVHITLGCLGIVMMHHLVGGRWGFVIRRVLEAGAMTLPLMAVLFIPLLFGLPQLYIWAQPEHVAESALLQHKALYLNVPFFVGRAVVYFVAWFGLAYLLNRWSAEQDKTGHLANRLKSLSAPGLILFFVTVTFASFDWMMSLEPEWFSSIYGVLFLSGQALVGFAFATLVLRLVKHHQAFSSLALVDRFNDLANFLLAFVAFWAYIAFSQYLIIWSGNLPEEVGWYLNRTQGGWQWIALALILLHFTLPFILLLARRAKRQVQIVTAIAGFIILMRLVDLFWLVIPAFYPRQLGIHWLNVAVLLVALVGIGGLWVWFFAGQLKAKPLLPLRDPRFQEPPEQA